MRILSVTQSYYPFMASGGPAVKVRAMAQGLARRGHEVTVLTSDLGLKKYANGNKSWSLDRWGWRSETDGVEAIYMRQMAHYRSMTWNPDLFAFCRERLADFRMVHIFGFYDLFGPTVARACRHAGIPYVLEPMGMFRPIVRNIPLKRVYRYVLGDAMVLGAELLVATAPQEQQELVDEGVPKEKVIVRRNGIERPEDLPEKGLFRSQWNIPKQVQLILFLGRIVSKKSPDLLLEAFALWRANRLSNQDSILVLAGPDQGDGYREQLERRAADLKLGSAVLFTGPLYDSAKWAAFRDADLFVLPSQNENFGNTAAEAVSCGTPVLLTDCCGIAPLIDGRAGLVVSHETDALVVALECLLDNAELRERLKRGCADVARMLDWKEPLDATEVMYAKFVKDADQNKGN
jgi:glycosyltransferase involved in cell wall biosynthesis